MCWEIRRGKRLIEPWEEVKEEIFKFFEELFKGKKFPTQNLDGGSLPSILSKMQECWKKTLNGEAATASEEYGDTALGPNGFKFQPFYHSN